MMTRNTNTSKFLLLTYAAIGYVACKFSLGGMIHRSLEVQSDDWALDDRPICSGERHQDIMSSSNDTEKQEPYYKTARDALHLGFNCYGQTNNQILALFNAIDGAKQSGGTTVVAVSGSHLKLLKKFFPEKHHWEQLEQDLPVVDSSENHNLNVIPLDSKDAYLRRSDHFAKREDETYEMEKSRRVEFLHYLFSNLRGESCNFYHQIQSYLVEKFGTSEYIAVHIRNFEGNCWFSRDNMEQCYMNPSFIKEALMSTGFYSKLPIVVLSDMQNETKLHNIQDELEKVVVPEWDLHASPSILDDMVVGAMSEVFLGNQGSSASRNIGELREAFGKGLDSNLIFIQKNETGFWENTQPDNPNAHEE